MRDPARTPTSDAAPTPRTDAADARPADPAGALAPPGASPDLNPANESDLWHGRTSWKHFVGRLAVWVLLMVAAGFGVVAIARGSEAIDTSGGLLMFAGVALVAGVLIGWPALVAILGNRYRLTSQRLFIDRGILSVTVDQLELIRVDDVRIHKSVTDRMFGLGTVEVISTDASDREIRIAGITDCDLVAEHIRRRMRTMRKSSLYVENL